jgi:hypothetical protein
MPFFAFSFRSDDWLMPAISRRRHFHFAISLIAAVITLFASFRSDASAGYDFSSLIFSSYAIGFSALSSSPLRHFAISLRCVFYFHLPEVFTLVFIFSWRHYFIDDFHLALFSPMPPPIAIFADAIHFHAAIDELSH